MGRPSKLTPDQWREIERRMAEGEGPTSLAREFGVSKQTISERLSGQSGRVREVAKQVAEAQTALASLPVSQQHTALTLADKFRSISMSYASAAELGAKTAHRFHALANAEAQRVDDADPLSAESLEALKGIAVLTKLGNEALVPASNLLAANKDTVTRINAGDQEDKPAPVRERLSLADWKKAHGLA